MSYSGSLPQWRSFLADTHLRPESFGRWKLALDPAKEIRLEMPRFTLVVKKEVLQLTEDSQLNVFPGTLMDGDTPHWDVLAIQFSLEARRSPGIGVVRRAKPAADAGQVANNRWQDMVQEKAPFNGRPVRNQVGGFARQMVGADGKTLAEAQFLYDLSYSTTTQVQGEIQRAMPQVREMFRVTEN